MHMPWYIGGVMYFFVDRDNSEEVWHLNDIFHYF